MQTETKRGRGRPLEFDRDEAVHIAVNEFWQRGFQAVSITDLAEAMSITRTSFYNSFGSRESIFREALDVYRKATPDNVLLTIEPGTPVTPVMRQAFRDICRIRSKDDSARGCLVVNSIGEIQELDEDSRVYLEKSVQASKKLFQKLIAQAVEQEEIPPLANYKTAGAVFLSFLIGLNNLSKFVRSEKELWAICDDFLNRYGFVETKRQSKGKS